MTDLSTGGVDSVAARTPVAGSAIDRYVFPASVVAVVWLGAALVLAVSGWLRGLPLGVALGAAGTVFPIGIAVLAHRTRRAEGPVTEPAESPAEFDSAFVCSRCAEYTPPPDWEALLRESGAADEPAGPSIVRAHDLVGTAAGAAGPALRTELPRGPWGEWLSALETSFAPPAALGGAVDPFDDLGFLAPGIGGLPNRAHPSGGGASPRRPAAAVGPEPSRLDSIELLPITWGLSAPSLPRDPAERSVPLPEIESWIFHEVEGIMALWGAPGRPQPSPEAELGSATYAAAPCAACRTPVLVAEVARECGDCRRPICEPCRERVVEHAGDAWCAPCAVNRLSAQFLVALEEPDSPLAAPPSVPEEGSEPLRPLAP